MNKDPFDEFMKFAYGAVGFIYLLVFFMVYICYQDLFAPLIHQSSNLLRF